jgi:hypothetical protein
MDLSVLASLSLHLGPLPVLSLLNLLPPGSYTRLQPQMLLLVLLVLWPLSHTLCSVSLLVSLSLLCCPTLRTCACCCFIVGVASLWSILEALACSCALWLSGLASVASGLVLVASDGLGSAAASDKGRGSVSS